MATRKELSELYQWIRKNNHHTPDEVVDFMYEAAKEKLHELSKEDCPNCGGNSKVEHRYTYEVSKCDWCKGEGKLPICPSCNGHGQTQHTDTPEFCFDCNGDGYLREE